MSTSSDGNMLKLNGIVLRNKIRSSWSLLIILTFCVFVVVMFIKTFFTDDGGFLDRRGRYSYGQINFGDVSQNLNDPAFPGGKDENVQALLRDAIAKLDAKQSNNTTNNRRIVINLKGGGYQKPNQGQLDSQKPGGEVSPKDNNN